MNNSIKSAYQEIQRSAGNCSDGPLIEHFGRPSWWSYLAGIPLDPYNDQHPHKPLSELLPCGVDLREFVQIDCGGYVRNAIEVMDGLIKSVGLMDDYSDYSSNLYNYLQEISTFFRDVEILLRNAKERPDKYKNASKDKNKKVSPLNFCLACHRTCKPRKHFCSMHSKPDGRDSDIKNANRLLNNAHYNLQNINLISPIPSLDLEIAFKRLRKKANALHGWAKNRDEHRIFVLEVDQIASRFQHIADGRDWNLEHKNLLIEIIKTTKNHTHTHKLFREKINLEATPEKVKREILINELGYDENFPITAHELLLILGHMSKLQLIKVAANMRTYKNLLSPQN